MLGLLKEPKDGRNGCSTISGGENAKMDQTKQGIPHQGNNLDFKYHQTPLDNFKFYEMGIPSLPQKSFQ